MISHFINSLRSLCSNQRGVFHIPMLLALTTFSLAGFGSWGLLRHWRHLTELQLRLDVCVGQKALQLKHHLQRIESGNQRIRALRIATAAAIPLGHAAPLIAASQLQARLQDAEVLAWQARQAQWLVQRGCASEANWLGFTPLPQMKWMPRLPVDPLGAHTLQWIPGESKTLRIQLSHSPRAAAAEITKGVPDESSQWKTTWVVPIGTGPF